MVSLSAALKHFAACCLTGVALFTPPTAAAQAAAPAATPSPAKAPMRSTSSLSGGGLSGGSLLGSGSKGSALGGATAGAAKAEGPQFSLDATYGGGLNQGERAAPWLKVRVGCEDVKPMKVTVDCHWIAFDGRRMVSERFGGKTVEISKDHSAEFRLEDDQWRTTNGTTRGIMKPGFGLYRGWVIAARDAQGKLLQVKGSQHEFLRHVTE